MTFATARCPICRYDVCPRSQSESIIESSKCVRRHQVTKRCGSPLQPLPARNGVTAAVRPPCMSTMVPYWSNTRVVTSRRRRPAISASIVNFPLVSVALVLIALAAIPWAASPSVGAFPEAGQLRFLSNERRASATTTEIAQVGTGILSMPPSIGVHIAGEGRVAPGIGSYEEAKNLLFNVTFSRVEYSCIKLSISH